MAKFIEHKFIHEVYSVNGLRLVLSLSDPDTVRLEFDGQTIEFMSEDIQLVWEGQSDMEEELMKVYQTLKDTSRGYVGIGWLNDARDWVYHRLLEFAENHGIAVNDFA